MRLFIFLPFEHTNMCNLLSAFALGISVVVPVVMVVDVESSRFIILVHVLFLAPLWVQY